MGTTCIHGEKPGYCYDCAMDTEEEDQRSRRSGWERVPSQAQSDSESVEMVSVLWDEVYSTKYLYEDGVAHTMTWREVADRQAEEISELRKWAAICADLDRCEHGRHEGDVCAGCGGGSRGNPFLGDRRCVGVAINGRTIMVPPRDRKHQPEAWTDTQLK